MAVTERFTVTHPDGTTSHRSSQTRIYTHALVVEYPNGNRSVLRWSLSEENATKAMHSREFFAFYSLRGRLLVVPVTQDAPKRRRGATPAAPVVEPIAFHLVEGATQDGLW